VPQQKTSSLLSLSALVLLRADDDNTVQVPRGRILGSAAPDSTGWLGWHGAHEQTKRSACKQ
jgi:hypothetical protein